MPRKTTEPRNSAQVKVSKGARSGAVVADAHSLAALTGSMNERLYEIIARINGHYPRTQQDAPDVEEGAYTFFDSLSAAQSKTSANLTELGELLDTLEELF